MQVQTNSEIEREILHEEQFYVDLLKREITPGEVVERHKCMHFGRKDKRPARYCLFYTYVHVQSTTITQYYKVFFVEFNFVFNIEKH